MWMFECRHKYEVPIVGEYQYCKKCGKGIPVPCVHKWERCDEVLYKKDGWTPTYCGEPAQTIKIYVLQCTKCGELRNHFFEILAYISNQ